MDPFALQSDENAAALERRMLMRDLGPQPIARVMEFHGLKAKDLVAATDDQLTHKMVARACKGRRLTSNTKRKLQVAVIAASGEAYTLEQLFNY